MKKFPLVALTAFVCFTFVSCITGLGEVVDIDGPELAVKKMVCIEPATADTPEKVVEKTSFETTIYTKKSMTFYGEATDNIAVTNVHVSIKWSDGEYTFLKNADFNDGKWELKLDLEKEGACWLKFTAEDKQKNYGRKSEKVVTLFVDESAPVGDAWYIDRQVNGIQYNFQSLESLKEIVEADPELTEPSNIDVAQNDEFLICGVFTDATGIADGLSLSLYNENGEKVVENIGVDSEETATNYSPKFKINGKSLGLPESGMHYYQIRYSADDLVGDPSPNSVTDKEVCMGWFLWWPESDNPKCSIATLEAGSNSMSVSTGDSLNITVFDDDALAGTVKCKLSGKEIIEKNVEITSSTTRESNIIIKVPDITQTMILNIEAKDMRGNSLTKQVTVYVNDETVPNLIITSPENNQIPSVTGTNAAISFTGITLDKTKSSFVEFVWVPDSVAATSEEKSALAKNWLNSLSANNGHKNYTPAENQAVKVSAGKDTYAGCKIWSAKLTDEGMDSAFRKYSFDFTISLLNDFGNDTAKDKYFIARVTREDGIYTDVDFKLVADNTLPEIIPVTPSGNMAIIDQDSDLYIKFKAEKSNGVQMNISKYKLVYFDENETEVFIEGSYYDETEGVYTSPAIEKSKLAEFTANNIVPKYKYYAEDILGNQNTAMYQFIISSLPQIKTVTSSAPEKCKLGQEIDINVSFSKTVTLPDDKSGIKLKLKGISNSAEGVAVSNVVYADYESGSGSTTLVFHYNVKAGDVSDGLEVYNEPNVGPITGMDESTVHLTTLSDANNLQSKRASNPITINGIVPKLASNGITISATGTDVSNKVNNVTYLKAGRVINASVTIDKKVTVQGSPKFILKNGNNELKLSWQKISADGKTLTFAKTIEATDVNGTYAYFNSAYMTDSNVIKDEFGNAFDIGNAEGSTGVPFNLDTEKPGKPVIKNSEGTAPLDSGKYNGNVSFTVSGEAGAKVEYYDYLAVTPAWVTVTSSDVKSVTQSASLVARATDYAGNVSDYSDMVNIDINPTFPDFTIECTNSDGNFKRGTVLTLKVSFAEPVKIPADSTAYIDVTGINSTDVVTKSNGTKANGKAELSDKTERTVTEAVFTYTTDQYADFCLKVPQNGVHLTGFTDQYGNGQSSKTLAAAYERGSLKLDSVAPYVVTMTPQMKISGDTHGTQNGLNAYDKARTIVLKFNENVNVDSGKIYLRQTEGWAIPPMFSATDFNKVLAAAQSAESNNKINTEKTYGLSVSQVLYMNGEEDAESLYGSTTGPANDRYHGTAQFIGPYKKMTNGVDSDGNPDLSVKYVLDFSLDIWSDEAMLTKYVGNEGEAPDTPRFGKTYEPHVNSDLTSYHHLSRAGQAKVVTPENVITTESIRYVLEQADYHQRIIAVNSSAVEVDSDDRSKVTLNFSEDILGNLDLPLGREWELVIEKGCFMDDAANKFGYESDGSLGMADSIQKANNGTQEGNWSRKRDTVLPVQDVKPLVLIQDGNNAAFMSAGVEKPVIRVDRYSYGLGIKQPVLQDGQEIWKPISGSITYQKIDSHSVVSDKCINGEGTTIPTALVGVRIDTESKGAVICYSHTEGIKNKKADKTSRTDGGATNEYTSTSVSLPAAPTENGSSSVIFLAGTGLLGEKTDDNGQCVFQSCKQYISAKALYDENITSIVANEGIFQTIVNISQPSHNGKTNTIYNSGTGRQVVNIHGTTGLSGEPKIAPFPLRDQALGSAYMRQTYQTGDQYYWISYEVLVESGYSMYVFGKYAYGNEGGTMYGKAGYRRGWGDWAKKYTLMAVGEFNVCPNLESWPAISDYDDNSIVPDNE